MCRILLVKSKEKIKPTALLKKFAIASKNSPALNGDMQKDGWGISYLDEKNNWQVYKSISAIWEDFDIFSKLPKTNIFLVHARSASYNKYINDVSVNQPYNNNDISYVFNGDIRGVTLKQKLNGKIGAQKIFSLLTNILNKFIDGKALKQLNTIMTNNSKKIIAMNVGYSDKKDIYALCRYTPNNIKPDYHKLYTYDSSDLKIICSEKILKQNMLVITNNTILTL